MPMPPDAAPPTTATGALLWMGYCLVALLVTGGCTALALYVGSRPAGWVKVVARVFDLAVSVVALAEVRLRPTFQSAAADGKLTRDEVRLIQAAALEGLKEALGEKGREELKRVLKLGDGPLEGYLVGLLERAFQFFKGSKAPQSSPAPLLSTTPAGGALLTPGAAAARP